MMVSMTRLILCAALCVWTALGAGFTLEQILGSAFPYEMTAAPAGGHVAWVENLRGVRNIRVASPPGYQARTVTAYTADDGQEISQLAFAPDGRTVIYVRGGAANRQGEIPNPTSDPAGAEQALWVVSLDGGAPRKLADGHSPAISPKGDRVAFLNRGQVWWVALDGKQKATQAIKARGQASQLAWSPDGSLLAFTSGRGDHSFIAVFDPAAKSLRFLDPGLDRDGNPVWSPDGKRIAFLRVPAERRVGAFGPRREAQPWSIRVAEVGTGEGRQIWRADPGDGSAFRFVVAESQLFWGAGDRLVFPWEKDGWTHLYSVPEAGGPATLLTPGAFEVEHVTLAPGGREVVFSSNQDDIDRRHLWRASVVGGRPRAVTAGQGIEWAPVVLSDGATIAFCRSDARRPARATIVTGSGEPRDLAPDAVPAEFPSVALIEPQPVTFAAADGMSIPAQLFLPAGLRSGDRRPAVIFFHGGSRRQMLLGWHYSVYYHNAYALNQYLASRGYVVLSVNYRSGIGYGMKFREALDYGAAGASEYQDVVGAGLYLRGRPDVDPTRIGLWGGSYGGYLTAMGLARASDLFAAGVDLHGVHDWSIVIRNFVTTYDAGEQQAAARLAFDSSPVASLKTWRSPVLLVHGDDDRNVPFSESVNLAEPLRAQGVHCKQLIFPDEVHSFLRHANRLRAYRAAADFFDRRLAGR